MILSVTFEGMMEIQQQRGQYWLKKWGFFNTTTAYHLVGFMDLRKSASKLEWLKWGQTVGPLICLIEENLHELITLVSGFSCQMKICVKFLAECVMVQAVFSVREAGCKVAVLFHESLDSKQGIWCTSMHRSGLLRTMLSDISNQLAVLSSYLRYVV